MRGPAGRCQVSRPRAVVSPPGPGPLTVDRKSDAVIRRPGWTYGGRKRQQCTECATRSREGSLDHQRLAGSPVSLPFVLAFLHVTKELCTTPWHFTFVDAHTHSDNAKYVVTVSTETEVTSSWLYPTSSMLLEQEHDHGCVTCRCRPPHASS